MKSVPELVHWKPLNIAIGTALGLLWAYFGYRHLVAFQAYGIHSHLLFGCIETLIGTFFILRSAPQTVSTNPLDWLIAFIGSFATSFYDPSSWGILPEADKLVYAGLILQIFGILSLNKSLAIVPAKRQIKTRGMYRVVRHPLYTSHILAMTGYVLVSTSTWNMVVYAISVAALFIRIIREERHLALDPIYRQYMQQVRYRLVPLVY
jgi:protein-S-isoprenylcysteine O-methyltransferase Ste14